MDCWGGLYENCMCLLVEVVCCVCEVVGFEFIIIYCFLMIDFVFNGLIYDEVVILVKVIEVVGVMIINMGIGWYEVCIFIIVILVLCCVFVWVMKKLMG